MKDQMRNFQNQMNGQENLDPNQQSSFAGSQEATKVKRAGDYIEFEEVKEPKQNP